MHFMYKCKILADKISNLTDARYFSARFADIICFDPDAISADDPVKAIVQMNLMKEWLAGPQIFVRTNLRSNEELERMIREVEPDGILISCFDQPDEALFHEKKVFRELIVDQDNPEYIFEITGDYDGILIDVRQTGLLADSNFIQKLKQLTRQYIIFIKNDDLNEAAVFTKQNVSFANLAINGMAEHRTGFRSYDDTDDILQQLEV